MRRFFQIICISVLSSYAYSQNGSSIDFVIKNLGINVDGHFNDFEIHAKFNSLDELLNISGKILVSSIETGIDKRDAHVLEADYFDTENYKHITLESTAISKTSDIDYTVKANLAIKGKTKHITIPVTVQHIEGKHKITSFFEINRKDFDVGGGSLVMGKTVKISIVHYQEL